MTQQSHEGAAAHASTRIISCVTVAAMDAEAITQVAAARRGRELPSRNDRDRPAGGPVGRLVVPR